MRKPRRRFTRRSAVFSEPSSWAVAIFLGASRRGTIDPLVFMSGQMVGD